MPMSGSIGRPYTCSNYHNTGNGELPSCLSGIIRICLDENTLTIGFCRFIGECTKYERGLHQIHLTYYDKFHDFPSSRNELFAIDGSRWIFGHFRLLSWYRHRAISFFASKETSIRGIYTAIEPYLLKETQFFSFFNSIRPKFYASRLSIVILQIDQSPTRSFVNEPHKRQPAPTARFASKKRGSALLIRRLFHRRGN